MACIGDLNIACVPRATNDIWPIHSDCRESYQRGRTRTRSQEPLVGIAIAGGGARSPMHLKFIFVLAISTAFSWTIRGQNAPPAPAPAGESVSGLALRSLPAVLDARERRQDWHEAA